jgi:hypothetical protein
MRHLTESLLEYEAADLTQWVTGQRERWVEEPVPSHVANQPNYHFGEYFVLTHFRQLGWSGFRFYALGTWEPSTPKVAAGRAAVERTFPPERLAAFRQARETSGRSDGKGEPDLFLHRNYLEAMFVEVKKQGDVVSREQLECIAQISNLLAAEVRIVYLVERGKTHVPREYDLSPFLRGA